MDPLLYPNQPTTVTLRCLVNHGEDGNSERSARNKERSPRNRMVATKTSRHIQSEEVASVRH